MNIESFKFGGAVLIVIAGLSIFVWGAINHENHIIEQADNLEKICLKAYKTDLKNDAEIKELCKNVKVNLFAEGELSESDYQEVKAQRHDARVRINELESMIEELEKGNNVK